MGTGLIHGGQLLSFEMKNLAIRGGASILPKDLAAELKNGNTAAFEQVYYLFKDKLYGFSFRLLGSSEQSKEVVQEVFVRLWERRATIDPDKSLKAYLYTIAKNLVKDQIREFHRELDATSKMMAHDVEHQNPIDHLTFKEIKEIEEQVIDSLTPQQREVYRLSRYQQLSHQEIATKLGISINSVKTHLRLALKALRTHLSPATDLLIIVTVLLSGN